MLREGGEGVKVMVRFTSGAYPEIFRGRGFETFLYGRENLGGFLGFFFKKP